MIVASPITPIENVLESVINWLGPHGFVGLPWAWAIVGLTVIVRLLLVPLTVKQIHSMQNLERNVDYVRGDNLEWLGLININVPANVGWGPLLIVIYVGSQLASTYFMSAAADKTQRILFFALPFLFVPFLIHFKA